MSITDSNSYLSVNFNQDSSSLLIGTTSGFKVITVNSTNDIKILTREPLKEIFILERSFLSSLMVYVSLSSPRDLCVINLNKTFHVANPYCYSNSILSVKLNRKRLVVALETVIHIHDASSERFLEEVQRITPIPANPKGLIALSASDSSLLAYPGSSTTGEVIIYDTINKQDKISIAAHDNPLAAIAFDCKGINLATASEKGTIIRVHDVDTGNILYEFRRGLVRAVIHSLTFSLSGTFLSATSNTETVHIFKLEPAADNDGWMNYLVKGSESYLPSISKAFNQFRSFATAKLPFKDLHTVAAVANIQEVPHVLVASTDGYLYIYDLDIINGGECNLVKQHHLDGITTPQTLHPGNLSYAAVVQGVRPSPTPATNVF